MTKTKKPAKGRSKPGPREGLARELAELLALVERAENLAARLAKVPASELARLYGPWAGEDLYPGWETDAKATPGWLAETLQGAAHNLGAAAGGLGGHLPPEVLSLAGRLGIDVRESPIAKGA
jgi:hypothetical protein